MLSFQLTAIVTKAVHKTLEAGKSSTTGPLYADLIQDIDNKRWSKQENHEDIQNHIKDVVLISFTLDFAVDFIGDAERWDAFAADRAYFNFFFFLASVKIFSCMNINW